MSEEFYPGSLKSGTSIGATSVIAEGVYLKGNLIGDKNLMVAGSIEGRIDLRSGDVIVRESGTVKANIIADQITIYGTVYGNVTGLKQVSVSRTGKVHGDITSPQVSLEEGCTFKGAVDMEAKALNAVIATLKAVERAVAQESAPGDKLEDEESIGEFLQKKAANE